MPSTMSTETMPAAPEFLARVSAFKKEAVLLRWKACSESMTDQVLP